MTALIAVTGGTGLVGGAVIDRLLKEGRVVRALARMPKKLTRWDGCLDVIEGDLDDKSALARLCGGASGLIHCAGITHARHDTDYASVNVAGARHVAEAARTAGCRMVHISSMSARRPEVSPYAYSKFESERAVLDACGPGSAVVLRLPAIYGPGDMATLPYFKMVKAGLAAEPATTEEARASLLHVEDAAAAILAALEEAAPGKVYEVGDDRPEGRSWQEIGAALGAALDVKTRRIRAPRVLLEVWHGAARLGAVVSGRPAGVRTGQLNEFFHPDWVARENLLSAATGWRPRLALEEGFAKTARWYQEKGLL